MKPLADRFWSKVNRRGPDECWPWLASVNDRGYGKFYRDGRLVPAHRVAYELTVGAIPAGKVLDHFRCDNPPCCNPTHVRPVTHRENLLRGAGVAAQNAGRTRCKWGHPLTEPNAYVNAKGARVCRACAREWRRNRYRQQRGGNVGLPKGERTRCPAGHPYDEVNTYWRTNGGRACRTCKRERWRRSPSKTAATER